jgi:hypothetical protein
MGFLGMAKDQGPASTGDFTAATSQQGWDNQNAALFNTNLNRADQVGPGGSLTWSVDANGRPVQTYALSSGQQGLYDSAQNMAAGIGQLGMNSVRQGQSLFASPVSQDGPWYGAGAASKASQAGVQYESQQSRSPDGSIAGNENVPAAAPAVATPAAPTATTSNTPLGQVTAGQAAASGQAETAQAQAALATLTNAGPAAQGQASAASAGGSIQRTFDQSGVRALPGAIDDTSRKRVEDAIMSRINPQYQNDESALRTRLLNSGIEVGTDAYNREMNNFSQRLNDARMQAVLAGGQEESRQVGLVQGLNQQEYQHALQTGQFAQSADTNMSNNQTQASIANAQLGTQASLANAGFLNQNNLANAAAANDTSRFNAGQSNSIGLANASQTNAANQYNLGQTNSVNLANAGFLTNANTASAGNATNASINAAHDAASLKASQNAAGASMAASAGAQALQSRALDSANHMQNITEQLAIRDQQLQEMQAFQEMSRPGGQQFGNYYTGGSASPTPTLQGLQASANNFGNQNTQANNNAGYAAGLINAVGNVNWGGLANSLGNFFSSPNTAVPDDTSIWTT